MRRPIRAILLLSTLAACGRDPAVPSAPATAAGHEASAAPHDAHGATDAGRGFEHGAYARDFAALVRVTSPFHRFEAARDAGWSAQITPCMSDPAAGGMGFHYGNPAIIDGAVSPDEPELLLYEPRKNGQMRLVAVEYIVPLAAWTAPEPPRLFGRDFHVNSQFQVWALHVWLWQHNPDGLFADWNPGVTCRWAS